MFIKLFLNILFIYTDAPVISGTVMLVQDLELKSVFCNYVSFPKYVFKPYSKVHVFLTVRWSSNSTVASPASSENDAAASWSEDLTSEGFKGCVLVAGRNIKPMNNVSLNWVAMQKESVDDHEHQTVGTIEFGTWYTGTRCQKIDQVKNSYHF